MSTTTQPKPPAGPLTADTVSCESPEQLDQILQGLSWLDSQTKSIESECKAAVAAVTAEHQGRMRLKVGKEQVSFADRRQALESAAREYCEQHRSELLADTKKKSRNFTWGSIAWRNLPAGLACAAGKTEADVVETIKKKSKLTEALEKLLARKLFGFALTQFIRIEVKLAKAAIKSASLPARTLRALGLVMTTGAEVLDIKPADYTVASEHSKAA